MAKANIKFENLRAEMSRKNLTIKDLADVTGLTRDTMGAKLSRKRPINLDEAILIQKELFPTEEVKSLFAELWDECDKQVG